MPRIEIAVEYVDGRNEVVTVGRPADLIAFADEFQKVAPDGPHVIRESTWLVHRALRVDAPFAEWVDTLEGVELVRGPEAAAGAPTEAELAGDAPTVVLPPEDPTKVGAWPTPAPTVKVASPLDWPARPHRRIATRTETTSPA
jgi:hypothetical protein